MNEKTYSFVNGVKFLTIRKKALIWLQVTKGTTFRSANHQAVQSGTHEGRQLYLAAPLPRRKYSKVATLNRSNGSNEFIYIGPDSKFGTVADGDSSMRIDYFGGKTEILEDFCVLVYRFDFYDLHRDHRTGQFEGFGEPCWRDWKGCVACSDYQWSMQQG